METNFYNSNQSISKLFESKFLELKFVSHSYFSLDVILSKISVFNFAYVVINVLEFFWGKKKKEMNEKKKVYRNSSSARKYIFGWSTRTQVSQLNVSSDNSSFFDHKPVLNRVYAGDEHFVNISRFKIYFFARNLHNLTCYANYFFHD